MNEDEELRNFEAEFNEYKSIEKDESRIGNIEW